jgi:predicted acyltransferase
MQQRNQTIDALRGITILAMVLSGSIAFGDTMPAWMYHAQVPPPLHKFDPTIASITWVDLVFPFFLFTLGAAIPLALQKQIQQQANIFTIIIIAFRRFVLLAFFALFFEHAKSWSLLNPPTATEFLLSIAAFFVLFFQFYNYKNSRHIKIFTAAKIVAFVIGIAFLIFFQFNGNTFSLTKSDIIIIVLANMALFATIIWWLTKNNKLLRLAILPFVMAIFLAAKEPTLGWAKTFYDFNTIASFKIDWLYKFYFLKYLFIVIPGTIAGDWILASAKQNNIEHKNIGLIGLLSFVLVISNTILLFTRHMFLNLIISAIIMSLMYSILQKQKTQKENIILQFFYAGAYLLLLGLFFEAYEGGIRKDTSTYSYYFVTTGLAFFMLIGFLGLQQNKLGVKINNFFALNGMNPMIAYVAGALLVTPILNLIGAIVAFEKLNANAWLGFLKGLLFTGFVSAITVFCTKRGWFWKS